MLNIISACFFLNRICFIWLIFSLLCAPESVAQSTHLAAYDHQNGIQKIQQGRYTWVAFSSIDYQQSLQKHKAIREQGHSVDIVRAIVDQQIYYRVVSGQFASRKEAYAARRKLDGFLPFDAWLLVMKSSFTLLPEQNWLPLSTRSEDQPAKEVDLQKEDDLQASEEEITETKDEGTNLLISAGETMVDPPELEEDNSQGNTSRRITTQNFEAKLQFSNIFEDNIDHDEDFEAVQSFGMVPAFQVRFRSSGTDPLFSLEYLVARHAYSNTERWDRVSNAFRGVIQPRISESFHAKTAAELSLKGSSEDRDISNQFQVVQEFEYRFTRRHRLQLYGTYRIKRFPDQPGAKDFKPNFGINFERTNSDGERFESGARYEFNKEEEARGNYKRWTFTVSYRSPEINEHNQFEFAVKHRRKQYTARFVEIENDDFLRQDNRLSIGLEWVREFKHGVTMEMGYEFETRASNNPEKLYEANAFSLVMIYEL